LISGAIHRKLYIRNKYDLEMELQDRTAIIPSEELLPVATSYELQASTGYNHGYLVKFIKEHDLNLNDMKQLAEYKNDHDVKFYTMGKLLDRNFSIEEIGELLQTRQNFGDGKSHYEKDRPTIEGLVRFTQTFFDVEPDSEILTEKIRDVRKVLQNEYVGMSIDSVVKLSERFNLPYVERVLEYVEDVKEALALNREGQGF
jgi:DNA-binding transcriptional MerR regulator